MICSRNVNNPSASTLAHQSPVGRPTAASLLIYAVRVLDVDIAYGYRNMNTTVLIIPAA